MLHIISRRFSSDSKTSWAHHTKKKKKKRIVSTTALFLLQGFFYPLPSPHHVTWHKWNTKTWSNGWLELQIDKSISLGLETQRLEAGVIAEMHVQLSWSRKQSWWHEMTLFYVHIKHILKSHSFAFRTFKILWIL